MLFGSIVFMILGFLVGAISFRQMWPFIILSGYLIFFPATAKDLGRGMFYEWTPTLASWAESLGFWQWEFAKLLQVLVLVGIGMLTGWAVRRAIKYMRS